MKTAKQPSIQLSLFDVFQNAEKDDILTEKANALLDLLNMDRKGKEIFEPQYFCQHYDLIVLIASNKEKNIVGNILDIDGNTPKDFCVNWRNLSIIRQELEEYKQLQS